MTRTAVVGLGITGRSVLQYLSAQGDELIACDTRAELADSELLRQQYPAVTFHLGGLEPLLTAKLDRVVMSPGVSLQEPVIEKLRAAGMELISDIDLFLHVNTAPVIAITGSNGKTTVTTWVGDCLERLGYRVQVCGNIGEPVLARVQSAVDYVVMELSSFQLEASAAIHAAVAICLNVSPDHLDRHGSLANYIAAKMRVYAGAKIALINEQAGYVYSGESQQLLQSVKPLSVFADQPVQQRKNREAVVAILQALHIDEDKAISVVSQCQGLKHRFQAVATIQGVRYINDSKATNVGAAIVAMQAAHAQASRVILLAGGQTKAAPLDEWAQVAGQCAAEVIIFGEDAALMQQALAQKARQVVNLAQAVALARKLARAGDIVLLAPAAASLDQFKNYEARGDCFIEFVQSEINK